MAEIKRYTPKEWEKVPCLFCGSNDYSLYEKFGCDLQYTYVKCSDCSLIFQSPRPKYDQNFIDAAYGLYYQFNETLDYAADTDVPQSSVKLFTEELDNILLYERERNAVLDIGAGMGTFLYAAKPCYKELIGLDMSKQMANFVEKKLGIKIYLEQFESFNYDKKFSLIHMSHVIEHVPNPNEWLAKAYSMLSDEGILVVNVPNKYALSYRLQHLYVKLGLKRQFSSHWNEAYARTPDHLFDPNVKSMRYVLHKNNFTILDQFSYSRKDPASNKSFFSKIWNRRLFLGSNLSFIVKKNK